MSTLVTTEIFKYSELSDSAKGKARQWLRDCNSSDNFWSECVIDDAKAIGKLIGKPVVRKWGQEKRILR